MPAREERRSVRVRGGGLTLTIEEERLASVREGGGDGKGQRMHVGGAGKRLRWVGEIERLRASRVSCFFYSF